MVPIAPIVPIRSAQFVHSAPHLAFSAPTHPCAILGKPGAPGAGSPLSPGAAYPRRRIWRSEEFYKAHQNSSPSLPLARCSLPKPQCARTRTISRYRRESVVDLEPSTRRPSSLTSIEHHISERPSSARRRDPQDDSSERRRRQGRNRAIGTGSAPELLEPATTDG